MKIKVNIENTTKENLKETMTCQNATEGDCLRNLKKYYTLMQLSFEVNEDMYNGNYLGFGTYLAYFSRILANPAWRYKGSLFLMNNEMTEEEKEVRQYMTLILNNLGKGQHLANISIWELVKYLHANPDEYCLNQFAGAIQKECGCYYDIYYYGCYDKKSAAFYFRFAWKSYSKAYFVD